MSSSKRLEQALLTPDTEGILQRGGAMSWQQQDRSGAGRAAGGREAFRRRLPVTHGAGRWLEREGGAGLTSPAMTIWA